MSWGVAQARVARAFSPLRAGSAFLGDEIEIQGKADFSPRNDDLERQRQKQGQRGKMRGFFPFGYAQGQNDKQKAAFTMTGKRDGNGKQKPQVPSAGSG